MTILYVAMGGALGSALRYLTSSRISYFFPGLFPYGTLCVNIIGSFLAGILATTLLELAPDNLNLKSFLIFGLLGGFTTFSAFSLDSITLIERGEIFILIIYLLSSVILGILGAFMGKVIAS